MRLHKITNAISFQLFFSFLQCKQDSIISSADWQLDPQELASKFNCRTKLILLNNPNNPLGKVVVIIVYLFYLFSEHY